MKRLLFIVAALAWVTGSALAVESQQWVGKKMPSLPTEYLGTKPDLSGKPLIVEFWATWCPPCRQSIPHLNEINAKYKDKGLVIIGVSNEERDVIKNFQTKIPMTYPVALQASGELGNTLGVEGIPHAFVVDRAGKITWQGHPMELTPEVIEAAIKSTGGPTPTPGLP
jgi:thiol-disulfide isomerase/thioredoxin